MPVIYGLTFVFRALGLSYQEVAIALLGENRSHYRQIRNFALVLGVAASAGLTLIAWTPLNRVWFESVSGLSPQLSSFAALPLQIMAIFPALTVLVCFQRAILIVTRKTKPISWATAVEAVGIISLLWLAMLYLPLSGALAASLSYILGRLLAVAALHRASRNDARQLKRGES
jgi:O-antigen/teichoic acid export membrane protein